MQKLLAIVAISLGITLFTGPAFAQTWSAEQQELWKL